MTDIGAYRVVGKLGEGGMGSVYVCEHALLGRRAAIKMLLPSLSANEEIVQRFFNEARAVTRIHDAGIVQIFDFGFHVDGCAFIVMELLDGEPMDRRLARIGRFGVAEALRLARLMCTSLAAAHTNGIVHRDLKPENVFLVGDAAVTGGERPKILDFGIAKLSDAESVFKTQTGILLGTPVYMSPEQCRGSGDVDHRADIYSMGCMMFAMLSGGPPFWREGSGELIAAHIMEPAPRLAAMLPGLAPGIDDLVDRCLAKDPATRFQSMEELARALGRVEEVVSRSTTDTVLVLRPLPAMGPTPTTMSRVSGEAIPTPMPELRAHRRTGLVAAMVVATAVASVAAITALALRDRGPGATAVSTISAATRSADAGRVLVPISDATVAPPDAPTDAPLDAPMDASPAPSIDAAPRAHIPFKRPPPHQGATHDSTTEPEMDRGD